MAIFMNEVKRSQYFVAKKTIEKALKLGLAEDRNGVILWINNYCEKAEDIDHRFGNKKYGSWIFRVNEDNVVKNIHLIRCEYCNDTKKITVYDDCAWCEGAGCKHCHDNGHIENQIPCHHCS